MNPGTTMFIVVGIIGLLMYALKAVRSGSNGGSEGFASLDGYNAVNSLFVAPVKAAASEDASSKASAQFQEALVNIRVAPAIQPSYTVMQATTGESLTISDKQGAELQKARTEPFANPIQVKPCPQMPDMSLYVRKDQIPCWGCTLK
jgi:hypothetical protein